MGVKVICSNGFVVSRCRCSEVHNPVRVLTCAQIDKHGHVDRLAGWQYVVSHHGALSGACPGCRRTKHASEFFGALCEGCAHDLVDASAVADEPADALEPTKQRPGDQLLPAGGAECVQDLVIEAMEESKRVGAERYGSPLMTFNGRKGVQDLVDELRDGFVYGTMLLRETEASQEQLVEVVHQAMERHAERMDDVRDIDYRALAIVAVNRVMGWVAMTTLEARGDH